MEAVVCIPSNTIPDGLYINDGSETFERMLYKIASSRFLALRDKEDTTSTALENNTNVRQLVTYIIMKDAEGCYIYQRTKGTGEKRLAGLYALPGGHMNSLSEVEYFHRDVLYDTMREALEETTLTSDAAVFYEKDGYPTGVTIEAVLQNSCIIGDNMVQLVHTAIVTSIDVSNLDIKINEKSKMTNLTRVTPENYVDYLEKSEMWLQMILPWVPQIINRRSHET